MQRLRKYQRFAARCLQEARATADPRLRALLADMAQEWQRLVIHPPHFCPRTHPPPGVGPWIRNIPIWPSLWPRRSHKKIREVLPRFFPPPAWSPRAGLQFLILTGRAQGLFAAAGATPAMKTSGGPCATALAMRPRVAMIDRATAMTVRTTFV